jgi:hypothetical protein
MKFAFGFVLGLAITLSPALFAQEPAPDKQKPKPEEPAPAPKTPEPNSKQEPQPGTKPNPQQQQEKQQKDQQKAEKTQEKDQEKQAKNAAKQGVDKSPTQQPGQHPQQNKAQASNANSGAKGQRIPPQKFQASFGSQHQFRVHRLEDGRRFQYGGYWFEMVEVWPAGWSYDDECYIDEDGDDYYLVDAFHPDARVMIIVVET